MKKIILSMGSILFASALLAGATGAFYGGASTSTGNTFASGVVELKIDNESYATNDAGALVASPSTSWSTPVSDLAGKFFFKFLDIKPGDIGEDTISLHVNTNSAWACMAVNLTGTPENGQPEPEVAVDPTAGANDGELQNNLNFAFWGDDGDNVYEQGEVIFKQGLVKDLFQGDKWALADATHNVWGTPGPLAAGVVKYVGKAWCFGTLSPTPKAPGSGGPLARGTGFKCDGEPVGNIVQSDGVTADVSFSVAQSRNNGSFLCSGNSNEPPPPPTTSTLFSENFNKCSKSHDDDYSHSWHKSWDKNGGYGDDDKDCTQNADLDGSSQNHTESLVTPSINTQGYHNITLKYDRTTDDTSGPANPQTLTVEYQVTGNPSWINIETVNGETALVTKSFSLSPQADNKASLKIRFTLVGTNSSNHAYIDNVSVTGVSP